MYQMASKAKGNGKDHFEDDQPIPPNTAHYNKQCKAMLKEGADLLDQKKEIDAKFKELAQRANITLDMEKKAFRILVKEYSFSEAERLKQHRIEEQVDSVRNALGWL